jgi:hypothetical protein
MKLVIRPTGGHILDVDPSELSMEHLSYAHNVHFRKNFPSRINGRRIAYPVSGGGLPNDASGECRFKFYQLVDESRR